MKNNKDIANNNETLKMREVMERAPDLKDNIDAFMETPFVHNQQIASLANVQNQNIEVDKTNDKQEGLIDHNFYTIATNIHEIKKYVEISQTYENLDPSLFKSQNDNTNDIEIKNQNIHDSNKTNPLEVNFSNLIQNPLENSSAKEGSNIDQNLSEKKNSNDDQKDSYKVDEYQEKIDKLIYYQNQARESLLSKLSSTKMKVRGLKNLGNTCYINSILQCLINNPIFQAGITIVSEKFQDKINSEPLNSFYELYKTYKNPNPDSSKYLDENLFNFKKALAIIDPKYSSNMQQDAYIFLGELIFKFHSILNESEVFTQPKLFRSTNSCDLIRTFIEKKEVSNMIRKSIMGNLFQNMIVQEKKCPNCNKNFFDFQETLNFSISGLHNSLEQNLSLCFEKSIIDGYQCNYCQKSVNIENTSYIWESSPILVINFKKYHTNNGVLKIKKNKINIPKELDLKSYHHEKSIYQAKKYELTNLIIHEGTFQEGHYFSLCKMRSDWILLNDQKAKPLKEKEIKFFLENENTLMCFYSELN
jgi:ubiquitin carboxyl-terminal hydrolase 2